MRERRSGVMSRSTPIYVVIQHVQVGEIDIHAVFLDELAALRCAERMRTRTGTNNYETITMYDGEEDADA